MKCPACGTDNREGANFCRMCGGRFSQLSESEMPGTSEGTGEEVLIEEPVSQAEATTMPPVGMMPEGAAAESEPQELVPEVEGVEAAPDRPTLLAEVAEATSTESTPHAEGTPLPLVEPEPLMDTVEATAQQMTAETRSKEKAVEAESPGSVPGARAAEDEGVEDLPEEPIAEVSVAEAPAEEGEGTEAPGIVSEPEDEILPALEPHADPVEREEVEPLTPVEPETVIAGRYAVVEALDVQKDRILYHADDLKSCWQCGFEDNAPDDTYCAQCGILLEQRPQVLLLEVQDDRAEPSGGEGVATRLTHEGRSFVLLAKPETEVQDMVVPQSIRLLVGQRSDPGQVRALDEDSLLALTLAPTYESRTGPVLGLFAVADGMGGHEGGEVASKMALQALADEVLRAIILPEIADLSATEETVLARLRQATIAANDAVYLTRQKRENDMGTTLTTALVRDDRLFLAHVGDCRAYRWNADGLEQLTTDHSLVASMVASGQAQAEEIYTHPHRSVIYRCIGDKPVVEVDTSALPLDPDDRIIICCDGLWEMIRDEGIEDVMLQEPDPQAACDLLVSRANMAGGEDNISVIVVQVSAG